MENLNFSFPIDLVKKEQRIVVGIATADNVDKAGDLIEFQASMEAFKNWAGNIREMHSPIAVGKAIDYKPVIITDVGGNKYNAIQVEAYISKGAQDTWEKVLDGTLRSFSVGGKILEKQLDTKKMFRGKPVNVIKKYELGELSLVDNPANPTAVIDVVKFDNSSNLDYILKIDCEDINLTIPESVKRMAQVGLNQRKEHGRGGTSVGLSSARRLASGGTVSPEFVRKVARYFPRHAVDLRAEGADPGDDGYPSNGRIAWNLWGGTPGWVWARSKVRQLDNCTKKMNFSNFEKENNCSCGCGGCDGDIIKEFNMSDINKDIKESDSILRDLLLEMSDNELSMIEDSHEVELLLNDENYDKVSDMNVTAEQKLSLVKRFINWLSVDEQMGIEKSVEIEEASTESEVEADNNQMEDQMDLEILKDALGSVIDQKLTDFAASLKEEVETSVDAKIEEVAKSADNQLHDLEAKLAAAEQALAEQTAKVDAYASAGAIKKSVDPEDGDGDEDELVKSAPKPFWNNVYLPSELINALGYES
jgi:hypothetical protein